MPAPRLDTDTARRLASGALHPDDAPPGFERVARLLAEAGSIPDGVHPQRAEATVGAMVATVATRCPAPVPARRLRRVVTTKAAVVAATLALGTTGAAAATGSLPGPLQDAVATAVSHVGLALPDSAGRGSRPGERPVASHVEEVEGGDQGDKGAEISGLVRDPSLDGGPKGPVVAPAASNGHSRAGQAPRGPGEANPGRADVTTPAGTNGVPGGAGQAPDVTGETPGEGADMAGDPPRAGPAVSRAVR